MSIPVDDHKRAELAFTHIGAVQTGSHDARRYRAICLKLPALVHQAGLAPALHFVAARMHTDQALILSHLATQLQLPDAAALLRHVREQDFKGTQRLTLEIQRCLAWYKRFAQSELHTSPPEGA